MQKLGYLASILLLTAVIVGPVGLSFAAPVDTAAAAKGNQEKGLEAFYQMKGDRFMAQKQTAADIKAKADEAKKAAGEDIKAAIAARADAMKKADRMSTADFLAKLRDSAKAVGNAFPHSGTNFRDAPSKSQTDLEQQRAALADSIAKQKDAIKSAPEKDVKVTLDKVAGVPSRQNMEQKVKDTGKDDAAKKAEAVIKDIYGGIHYNRK